MGLEFLDDVSAVAVYKKLKKRPATTPLNSVGIRKIKKKKLNQNKSFVKPVINENGIKKPKKKKSKTKTSVQLEKAAEINSSLSVKSSVSEDFEKSGQTLNSKNVNTKKLHTEVDSNQVQEYGDLQQSPPKANSQKIKKDSDSISLGKKKFQDLLKPVNLEEFFVKYWEKSYCFIKHQDSKQFTNLISFEAIDRLLRQHHIEYTKNIDITSYTNGVRQTLNPEGRALPPDVWNFYNEGCSIRLLNPQTFVPAMFSLNTTLQEYFHCMVGANVYLTPPNSQGFAPHYDDIEAFVLQVEGKKHWKIYKPRSMSEQLPRYSSQNLNSNEIGKPIFEKTLEPGDILYFPRGFIHQANTTQGHHSLHITLSVYQKQSYADLFEKLVPAELSKAITNNVKLRQGLPLDIWKNFGIIHSNNATKERNEITKKCKELLKELIDNISLDDAVDQLAKKFYHDALPPFITENEAKKTVFGHATVKKQNGMANMDDSILNLDTKVKLLRAHVIRLVAEENVFRIYYYIDNSREYHEYDPNFIEIEQENVISVKKLINSYPNFIKIREIPLKKDEDKLSVAQMLWDRGILITEKLLN